MTLIVRVFATEKKARDAAKKLKSEGFSESSICVIAPPAAAAPDAAGGDTATTSVAAAVESSGLPAAYASMAADHVNQGQSVVAIDPPFGRGVVANRILESFGPIKVEKVEAHAKSDIKSRLTSEEFGIPLLWNGKSFLANLFGGELTNTRFFLFTSGKLSSNPTPLSSAIGMKVLSESKKDWNLSMGQPMLSSKATPLSSAMGLQTLTEPKKDWTHSFGIPLLSSNPTPLSSKLGFQVLKK